MRIVIAADHGGFRLKAELVSLLGKLGHEVKDLGTDSEGSVDYPDFAHQVARAITTGTHDKGILVCGTGVGMSIAANRHAGVRAVVCSDVYTAKLSRSHNDANVLCLGERVVGPGLAGEILSAFLAEAASTDDRHARRRAKIEV